MIAEAGLAKLIATGGGLVSGVVVLAGMAGGTQQAASSAEPAKVAAAVCAYVPPTDHVLPGATSLSQRRPASIVLLARLGLDAEQAANARTIIDTAAELGLPERAAVIAVAAALQESNLNAHAVGDSGRAHGLFQMHPEHDWGTRAQVTNPEYAAQTFYSRLVKVPDWERKPLTVTAQAVERSAFPNAYARHEIRARKIVNTLRSMQPPTNALPTESLQLSTQDLDAITTGIQTAATLGVPRDALVSDVVNSLRYADLQAGDSSENKDYVDRAERPSPRSSPSCAPNSPHSPPTRTPFPVASPRAWPTPLSAGRGS